MLVVLADQFGQQVERARGADHVVDLVEGGQRVRNGLDVPLDVDPDHCLPGEADGEGVGDGDDLHHALVEQLLNSLAHGRLRQAHGLADGGVRAPPVLLQLLDDRLGGGVEWNAGVPVAVGHIATVPDRIRVRKRGSC